MQQIDFTAYSGVLPGLMVMGVVVAARLTGSMQGLEWSAFDRMLRSRPLEPMDERVVIVGITESDIGRLGTYPIPDRTLAQLLTTLQGYQPTAIGVDLFRDLAVPPGDEQGYVALKQAFQSKPNIIAIEKILPGASGYTVSAPPYLPPEQVGFADALPDSDGAYRRSLLGSLNQQKEYRFSFSIRLVDQYLAPQGLGLRNGERDSKAMQFGNVEIPRFQPNTGGYVRTDAGGEQTLLNFRKGRNPFRRVSLEDIETGRIQPEWFRGKIILIGITAESARDTITSSAVDIDNPSLFYGVEAQAHAVSQLLGAVLDGRPLLRTWTEPWEYTWIAAWSILGLLVAWWLRSPLRILAGVAIATLALLGSSYGALLWGWWLPLVPALIGLVLNGAGLALAAFYRQEQDLRSRLIERQAIIEHTFSAIHNGPLQTLATLLKQTAELDTSSSYIHEDLQHLNQELRAVYESVRKEALVQSDRLYLSVNCALDLQSPLHELLYEVYSSVLERGFEGFQSLKLKVVRFEPMVDENLTLEQRRSLCRFLEEALCNVGKHAVKPTRLQVNCSQLNGINIIRVVDNGANLEIEKNTVITEVNHYSKGIGTKQAKQLARKLHGQYRCLLHSPDGTICELTWPSQERSIPWNFAAKMLEAKQK
ncbi:CHASE2 domain-containing protein [Leptolyngbya sp. FACHB-8]